MPRGGGWKTAAAALAFLAGACTSDPFAERPTAVGNTFDRFNALAVAYPDSLDVSISYEFALVSEGAARLGDESGGPVFLYVERTAALPERFVLVHLVTPVGEPEPVVGELVRLGRNPYASFVHCVDPWDPAVPADLRPFVELLLSRGHALSRDLFLRRFVQRSPGVDGRRVDFVYIEDLTRQGYSCDGLADFDDPDEAVRALVRSLKARAQRSFEILG